MRPESQKVDLGIVAQGGEWGMWILPLRMTSPSLTGLMSEPFSVVMDMAATGLKTAALWGQQLLLQWEERWCLQPGHPCQVLDMGRCWA